ncbi:MAG: 50S ribosomal protein L24 [Candidatus Liptonbacteria bacterium]|nr:50S ribosomal protein L24 [Candidatus Liptonbacteria bacterium]
MNLKKGDQVKIISGKDRGRVGSVLRVFVDDAKVTIEGQNLYKKRSRPKKQGDKGEVVMVPRPLAASKVMLVCKNCKKAVRSGMRFEGEIKVRYCKKCDSST